MPHLVWMGRGCSTTLPALNCFITHFGQMQEKCDVISSILLSKCDTRGLLGVK